MSSLSTSSFVILLTSQWICNAYSIDEEVEVGQDGIAT